MGSPLRVLVIDDEKNIRNTLGTFLEQRDCEVRTAADAAAALFAVGHEPFDLAFLDLRIGTSSGLDLIPKLLAERPALEIVVITAFATYETAVSAIKLGARNYLPKPFNPVQVEHLVQEAAERRAMQSRLQELEWKLQEGSSDVELVTASPKMKAVMEVITRAAAFDAPVLLRGESGTGKGVIARTLHYLSQRRSKPFVTVNCPTLSEDLLASELFGHAKGAFTGALRDQPGKVEAAHGGTLFLDEIGDISAHLQTKLLRFLQDHEFERVGETRVRKSDVRVVAATNRNLDDAVASGAFREDLYYRLNTIDLTVPPLHERPEDILSLARRFTRHFALAAGKPALELTADAEQAILAYAWPGNVRELRNVIERAVILSQGNVIGPHLLPVPLPVRSASPALGGNFTLEQVEAEHIQRVLLSHPSPEDAARILGIDPSTLWRKRKRLQKDER
jgi:NtrC-family two-component system response regulator AlgB